MANIEGQNWHREIGTPKESQAKYSDRSDFYSKRVNLKLGQSFDTVINDLVGNGYETFEGHNGKNMEREIKGGDQLFKILRAYYKGQYEMDISKAEKEAYLTLAYVMKTGGVPTNVDLLQIGGKIKIENGRLSIWHEDGNLAMDAIAMRPPTRAAAGTEEDDEAEDDVVRRDADTDTDTDTDDTETRDDEDLPDKGATGDEEEPRRGGGATGGTEKRVEDEEEDDTDADDTVDDTSGGGDGDKKKKGAKKKGGEAAKKKEATDDDDEIEGDPGLDDDGDKKKAAKKKAKRSTDTVDDTETDEDDTDGDGEVDDSGSDDTLIEDDELDGGDYDIGDDPGLDSLGSTETAIMQKWEKVPEAMRDKLRWTKDEAIRSGLVTPVDGGYAPVSGFVQLNTPDGNWKIIPVIPSKYELPNIIDRDYNGAAQRGHLWDMDAHEGYPLFLPDQFETYLSGEIEGDSANVDMEWYEGDDNEICVIPVEFQGSGAQFEVKKNEDDHTKGKVVLGEFSWTVKADSGDESLIVRRLASVVGRANKKYLKAKELVEEHWDSDDADEKFYMHEGEIYVETGNIFPNYSVYDGSDAETILKMMEMHGAPIEKDLPTIDAPGYQGDREIVKASVDSMVDKYADKYGIEDKEAFTAFLIATGHLGSEFAFANYLFTGGDEDYAETPVYGLSDYDFTAVTGNDGEAIFGENWIQQDDLLPITDFDELDNQIEDFITAYVGPAFRALKKKDPDLTEDQIFEHIAFNWRAGVRVPYYEDDYSAKMEEYDAVIAAANKEIAAGRNVDINESAKLAAEASKASVEESYGHGMTYLEQFQAQYERYNQIESAKVHHNIDLEIDEDMNVSHVTVSSRAISMRDMVEAGHERVYATANDPGTEKVMIDGEEYHVLIWHETPPEDDAE